jgi:hypothetical protein
MRMKLFGSRPDLTDRDPGAASRAAAGIEDGTLEEDNRLHVP